ncbi:MAG: hypothetical protein ACYC41_11935 [Bacillota bacterium]
MDFMATTYDKKEIRKLIADINDVCGEAGLDEGRLDKSFDNWWPSLKSELDKLQKEVGKPTAKKTERSAEAMLEEILDLVRGQQRVVMSRGGIPGGHPVFRDLRIGLMKLRDINSHLDDNKPVGLEEMQSALREIERPLAYLVRRGSIEDRIIVQESSTQVEGIVAPKETA